MQAPLVKLWTSDCLAALRMLPDDFVNCVVTSPPYWGLRDYGVDGQLGLEPTPEQYVARLVAVFGEARRVLREDGTLWLNLGDTYCNSDKWGGGGANTGKHRKEADGGVASWKAVRRKRAAIPGIKPKDLIGIPWRVAFALQAAGWYLRSDIIWAKPNAMPESVFDRPAKAHEYLFLLSKSERYHYDHEAVKERAVSDHTSGNGFKRAERLSYAGRGNDKQWTGVGGLRNRRTVWTISTKPFKGAHFATFPPALAEICIKAGCPLGGLVLDPFGGAGTTALVAERLDRRAISIELNPEYTAIAKRRLEEARRGP